MAGTADDHRRSSIEDAQWVLGGSATDSLSWVTVMAIRGEASMVTPVIPWLVARFDRPTSIGLQRIANRLLQVGTVTGFATGLRRRNPSVAVNGCLSLVFTSLPWFLEWRYGARIRPWQRLWISAAGLVHTLGMLGHYDRIWWWDHLAHTLSGVVVGGVADVVFRTEIEDRGDPDDRPLPARSRATFVVVVTLVLGLLWEVLEYLIHTLGDRVGFEPLLVHYGRLDAVGDLVFDAVGAGVVIVFGRQALSNVVDSVMDR